MYADLKSFKFYAQTYCNFTGTTVKSSFWKNSCGSLR